MLISDNDKISYHQFIVLMFFAIFEIGFMILPRTISESAGPDSWLSLILGFVGAILAIFVITRLSLRFPDKTFVELSRLIAGNTIGSFLSILLFLYFYFWSISTTVYIGNVTRVFLLERTPLGIVTFVLLLSTTYLIRYGIEPIARFCEFFILLTLLPTILLYVSAIKLVNLGNFKPFLADGILPVAKGTLEAFKHTRGIEFPLMIIPFISKPNKVFKGAAIGEILYFLLLIFPITIIIIGVFGTNEITHYTYPAVMLAKELELPGIFLERFDVLMIALWYIGGFTSVAISQYMLSLGITRFFKIENTTSMPLFLLPLTFLGSLTIQNIAQLEILLEVVNLFFIIVSVIFPIILLAISQIRNIEGDSNGK